MPSSGIAAGGHLAYSAPRLQSSQRPCPRGRPAQTMHGPFSWKKTRDISGKPALPHCEVHENSQSISLHDLRLVRRGHRSPHEILQRLQQHHHHHHHHGSSSRCALQHPGLAFPVQVPIVTALPESYIPMHGDTVLRRLFADRLRAREAAVKVATSPQPTPTRCFRR